MPVLSTADARVDYTDDGAGPPVVLVHSSVSANRQWRALIETLKDSYRVLAINLHGYGETTPWPGTTVQTLAAQAKLVLALCETVDRPVHLVGHSFGGSVALKVAQTLGDQVGRLILLEPNPFYLLQQHGRLEAYAEARALRDYVKEHGTAGDWPRVAERFADYWAGEGAWAAMPDKRRATFVASLPPNFYEWDALDEEQTPVAGWHALAAEVLVMCARDTRRSVREIYELFREHCPRWSFAEIAEGGHMAPLARPELVNPIIKGFLDAARHAG